MKKLNCFLVLLLWPICLIAQMGTRFPSERKVIKDPLTGVELVFLTSKSGTGDSKIYQTHNQWTADGKWVVFRSDRANGEALAVNEETGDMVQITEGGFTGMLFGLFAEGNEGTKATAAVDWFDYKPGSEYRPTAAY